jgi:hypothetical protein
MFITTPDQDGTVTDLSLGVQATGTPSLLCNAAVPTPLISREAATCSPVSGVVAVVPPAATTMPADTQLAAYTALITLDSLLAQQVQAATMPGDIPVQERNKLYVQVHRLFKQALEGRREDVPQSLIARYIEEKSDRRKMFVLLQDIAKDPSGQNVYVQQRHVSEAWR